MGSGAARNDCLRAVGHMPRAGVFLSAVRCHTTSQDMDTVRQWVPSSETTTGIAQRLMARTSTGSAQEDIANEAFAQLVQLFAMQDDHTWLRRCAEAIDASPRWAYLHFIAQHGIELVSACVAARDRSQLLYSGLKPLARLVDCCDTFTAVVSAPASWKDEIRACLAPWRAHIAREL